MKRSNLPQSTFKAKPPDPLSLPSTFQLLPRQILPHAENSSHFTTEIPIPHIYSSSLISRNLRRTEPAMASIWRTFRCTKKSNPTTEKDRKSKDVSVLTHFRCPISLDLMKDPVTASSGITYDRQSIEKWLDMGNSTCPVTNQPISSGDLIPNHTIRKMIQDWCVANWSNGIDRIPTPRTPLSNAEAMRILSEIHTAGQRGDCSKCLQLVVKMKDIARESERNKQCIFSNGAGRMLASSFQSLTRLPGSSAALEEIVSAMIAMLPLDGDACSYMTTPESLNSLVSLLKHGDLAARLNATLVVKELSHPSKGAADAIVDTKGIIEALVELVKEPVSPQATKAALIAAFYIISSSQIGTARFVELGMVHLALEILVDADRSMAEKALGVLDGLLGSDSGRQWAYRHALAVPVLVKKMLRLSNTATKFAVSALWKLCREWRSRCLGEAAQVGAFQKLLLVLQVGCDEGTKAKVKDMLKLLNGYKGKNAECVLSADFKGLKRSS